VKPSVFISSSVHGLEIAAQLSHLLHPVATPRLWSEGVFHAGLTVMDSLAEFAERVDFAVFILSSDDVHVPRRKRAPLAVHSNLLFELGFFMGRLGAARVFVVVEDGASTPLPSDLVGTTYISLHRAFASDLEAALAPAVSVLHRAIQTMGSLEREPKSLYPSCFISYSWSDQVFATKLHRDLENVGVRCWLDSKDMRLGERLSEQIKSAIGEHDKLLLVLSAASINSPWVTKELRYAFKIEGVRSRTVLFPVRVDDALFGQVGAPEFRALRDRYVGDFTDWHDPSQYQKSFSRLVRDLSISTSVESSGSRA
jgi:hypothetical protein